MEGIQGSTNSLARVVLEDRTVLDFRFMGYRDKVYTVANTSCCTWINSSSLAERSIQKHKEKATWLSKVNSDA